MKLEAAQYKAAALRQLLQPFCDRIEVAGSIRRGKPEPKDIELVIIPKQQPADMFGLYQRHHEGIATACSRYKLIRGSLIDGKAVRLEMIDGTGVDLFFCTPRNWGYIMVLRTGSDRFNMALIERIKGNGYICKEGVIWHKGSPLQTPEEADVFKRAGLNFIHPADRNL